MTSEQLAALRLGTRFSATTNNLSATAAVASTMHHNIIFKNGSADSRIILDKMLIFGSNMTIPSSVTIFVNPADFTATAVTPGSLHVGGGFTDTTTIVKSVLNTIAMTPGVGGASNAFELPNQNGDQLLSEPIIIAPGFSIGLDFAKAVVLGAVFTSGYCMFYYYLEKV